MSLICGTLTWLRDHEQNKKHQLENQLQACLDKASHHDNEKQNQNEPAWFTLAKKNISHSANINKIKEELKKIQLNEERIEKLKNRAKKITLSGSTKDLKSSSTNVEMYDKLNKMVIEDDDLLIGDGPSSDLDETFEEELGDEMVSILRSLFEYIPY